MENLFIDITAYSTQTGSIWFLLIASGWERTYIFSILPKMECKWRRERINHQLYQQTQHEDHLKPKLCAVFSVLCPFPHALKDTNEFFPQVLPSHMDLCIISRELTGKWNSFLNDGSLSLSLSLWDTHTHYFHQVNFNSFDQETNCVKLIREMKSSIETNKNWSS